MTRTLVAAISAMLVMGPALADPAQTGAGDPVPATPSTVVPLTMSPAPPPPPVKPASQEDSPSYVEGYSDGCASANLRFARQEHVKPNKDPKLYDSDKDYHDGWDHGYRKCEDKISPGGISVPANSVVL